MADRIDNAKAYIVTILRHVCFEALQSRRYTTDLEQIDSCANFLPDRHDIAAEAEQKDTVSLIKDLINRLPSPQREVIIMRDLDDIPFDEISRTLGINEGNIRVLLFRARKQIREQYKRINTI